MRVFIHYNIICDWRMACVFFLIQEQKKNKILKEIREEIDFEVCAKLVYIYLDMYLNFQTGVTCATTVSES